MFYIACTRFNNETYNENMKYREKNNEIAIYGTSTKIRNIYPIGCIIFVVEMNNETNKVEGIGLIRNNLDIYKRRKIYSNGDYNRYIYKGNYWLSREELINKNKEVIDILDIILFKGKSNLKRFSGITIITDKLFRHWDYELYKLKKEITNLFVSYYSVEYKEIEEIEQDKAKKIIICKKRKLLISN
jgi:hypothetical protein